MKTKSPSVYKILHSVNPQSELKKDKRDNQNDLVIDVHHPDVDKATFGFSILGMMIHLHKGNTK